MIENLKKKSIEKRTAKQLLERNLSERNTALKTLGFIVDENSFSEFEKLYDFYKTFGLQPKDVKVFGFVEVERGAPSLRNNQINNKDFSWQGGITNANALEFLNIPFDVLVGFYKGEHRYLDLLVAKSHAHFKVGFLDCNQKLFDLILNIDFQNLEKVKEELRKYFRVLGKVND